MGSSRRRSPLPLAARVFPLGPPLFPLGPFRLSDWERQCATGAFSKTPLGFTRGRLARPAEATRGTDSAHTPRGNSLGRVGHQGGDSLAPLAPSPLARRPCRARLAPATCARRGRLALVPLRRAPPLPLRSLPTMPPPGQPSRPPKKRSHGQESPLADVSGRAPSPSLVCNASASGSLGFSSPVSLSSLEQLSCRLGSVTVYTVASSSNYLW